MFIMMNLIINEIKQYKNKDIFVISHMCFSIRNYEINECW
jgi:hypothetical protein